MEARHESSIVLRVDGGKRIPFWEEWGEDLVRGLRKTLLSFISPPEDQDDAVRGLVFWKKFPPD